MDKNNALRLPGRLGTPLHTLMSARSDPAASKLYVFSIQHAASEIVKRKAAPLPLKERLDDCAKSHLPAGWLAGRTVEGVHVRAAAAARCQEQRPGQRWQRRQRQLWPRCRPRRQEAQLSYQRGCSPEGPRLRPWPRTRLIHVAWLSLYSGFWSLCVLQAFSYIWP